MIIYNVTIKISHEKHDDWLAWMKEIHIPEVMATQKFSKYVFSKVVMEDEEGTNYSIQYFCNDMDVLSDYQENEAPAMQKKHTDRYKDHFVAFRTLLEIV
ncbi:MAG: hypothetical protein ACI9GM_000401 [Salibacteraceae bacterium]|jgi:hypothetical protein